jgi:lipoprotein-anchoring transpeptidase ErfK/SrfK
MLVALLACLALNSSARAQDTAANAVADPQPASEQALLAPVELNGASSYRTRAQELVAGLVAAGETDLDSLIEVIVSDHREVLDHIVINIATQHIYECNVDGEVLHEDKVSSGMRGYDTPPGVYHVVNKAPKAYSEKYTAWMLHWMGLTKDGSYGMHGLEGSSYERHLGHVASHGCVRLSREYAKDLFTRVSIGMPVYIVNDPELNLQTFEPLSRQSAIAMVLEVLSPSDPWEIYY